MGYLTTNLRNDFSAIYNDAKRTITIQVVTRTRDDNDDISEATVDTSTNGVVNYVTNDFIDSDFGMLSTGDAVCYVLYSETVSRADHIVIGSNTFEVRDIVDFQVEGNIIYKKILLERIN